MVVTMLSINQILDVPNNLNINNIYQVKYEAKVLDIVTGADRVYEGVRFVNMDVCPIWQIECYMMSTHNICPYEITIEGYEQEAVTIPLEIEQLFEEVE